MTIDAVPAHVRGWIEVSESGTRLVLRIGGELDAATRASIEPALMAAIATTGSVVIDLDELRFCDSHGIAMFFAAREKAEVKGTVLAIRSLTPPVRRVFEITGLDRVFALLD